MATFHPRDAPPDAPSSELRVRQALASLGDEWHVFHQVRWQAVRAGRQGDGEADFLIVHPRHGILVLEVKGGRIAVVDGRWFATDRSDESHHIKDPFVQATASKHALLAYLATLVMKPTRICHGVVFPDGIVPEAIGMQPREIVLDGADLASADRAVERVLKHWGQFDASPMTAAVEERIIRHLAPTMVMRRTLSVTIAETEGEIITEHEHEHRGAVRST